MKKIIVETVGNSIMVSLFAASLVEFFSMNAQYTDNGFESTTGNISIVFVVYLVLFGLIRWGISKRNKDYSLKDGEFSASDEREKNNAYFASVVSYKAIITSLIISLFIFVFIEITTNPPFNNTFDLFISGIILFTIVICVGFISYGIAWIFKDTR